MTHILKLQVGKSFHNFSETEYLSVSVGTVSNITLGTNKQQLFNYHFQAEHHLTAQQRKSLVHHQNHRLLGVYITYDLSLNHRICMGCYYRLRQLRHLRQSLDSDSLATPVYSVVNSRIDYCNTVLAEAPRTVTDKLQARACVECCCARRYRHSEV